MNYEALEKVLLGTAIGDTIGLPMEGMKPKKIAKLCWTQPLRQRFFFGRGMWSDDTDHSLHIVDALTVSEGDPERFRKAFSRRLVFWLSTLPPGVGLATLKSIIKQALGVKKSGVFSAGNGPAMRAAVIGALFPHDSEKRAEFTRIHTELTHSDPKALEASQMVAEIAAAFTRGETETLVNDYASECSKEWRDLIRAASAGTARTEDALKSMQITPAKGVSGYSYHTVPAVVYVGLKNDWDFRKTITEIIALGGDTDSTAAIAGALCALHTNAEIPEDWQKITEFPVTLHSVKETCGKLQNQERALFIKPAFWPLHLLRNLTQLLIILVHIVTRILPATLTKNLIK